MPKYFYIFRHGETELNKQKRWQGSGMDYDLTELGIAQARDLAQKLQGKGIEKIYSSPLIRALHTAQEVGKVLNVEVEVRQNLRECFYGKAEGMLIVDLQKQVPEIVNNWQNPNFMDIRFEGGESKKEALNRVLAELKKISQEPQTTVGIAVHGGTMAALLNYFGFTFDKIPNCGVFCLEVGKDMTKVVGEIF